MIHLHEFHSISFVDILVFDTRIYFFAIDGLDDGLDRKNNKYPKTKE